MAQLPGRKVFFLVSDGFLVGLSANSGLGYDIRRITDAGTRADLRGHRVVFLDVGVKDAASRVGFNRDRPLLLGNPRAQWLRLMEKRRGFYGSIVQVGFPAGIVLSSSAFDPNTNLAAPLQSGMTGIGPRRGIPTQRSRRQPARSGTSTSSTRGSTSAAR